LTGAVAGRGERHTGVVRVVYVRGRDDDLVRRQTVCTASALALGPVVEQVTRQLHYIISYQIIHTADISYSSV
jgi:hypothetical protein